MLFQSRFLAGIEAGQTTLTFRAWDVARVKVGGRYRLAGRGELEVLAADRVALSAVDDAAARKAGFADRTELVAYLRARARGARVDGRTRVFRVRFRYHAPVPGKKERAVRPTRAVVQELAGRLERMDRLARREPWTRAALAAIEARPQTAAARLAAPLGRETRSFKADVRKLKNMGLTRSFEVGYELTPLGRAVLEHLRAR